TCALPISDCLGIPLMAPIGDIVGIPRQSVVLAFQLGDGLSNYLFPTSAILIAVLSIAQIPYNKWMRFVWPIMLTWVVASSLFMTISIMIGYGTFYKIKTLLTKKESDLSSGPTPFKYD